ncbi:16S rRNA (guanine(527)-N(7))-methyltransferase RsmG [Bradyrhizobium sp. 180]|nr:16S rRNA (guanine(527)-N(7))-methyltransferase RsmG [Bradyrhizobium sp. CW12]MCK1490813.1 16S rRNA (guanine(527)-N(7))-methyltransferase RsmG [Bradyrhizobium sp. 180]MCK1531822.1 16S rRNA (guanine(527)-N(7))-methyltransferase RsmG [Bradyrhizobium sp. 182]MCK1594391.1 16S rRNA (guanine(527)-N(7))-methyltransferase RsmG [Bradyrhizobium sp. 164]MCK1645923.1 16S rRNA (guanine(527)-N(7))-methyltransferase RsmG [Bradyrhizobium sp. 154]MCK1668017.1 16S rRNA (guanine(527)-N(7))-methyltransferase Rs
MKQRGPGGGRSSSGKPAAGEGAGRRPEPRLIRPKIDSAGTNDQSLNALIAADKIAALKLAPVSDETEDRLDRYIALLREWQAKTNLVAPSTLPHLWTRHIADSLQLVDLAPAAKRWADLGSGGGFPGIVLACAMAGRPDARVHLVERIAKKAAFLREAIRVTTSPGVVHLAEIGDNVDRITGPVDCVTARALAPLHQLIGFAEPLIRQGAKALFLKGQDVEAELTEAAKYWNIRPQLHPSRTGDGWIVELTSAERRG